MKYQGQIIVYIYLRQDNKNIIKHKTYNSFDVPGQICQNLNFFVPNIFL